MGSGGEPGKIETVIDRRVKKRLGQIGVFPARGRGSVGTAIAETDVPFSRHRRAVARIAKQSRQGRAVPLDHRIPLASEEDPVFQSIPPRITSRQQTISRRRAAGGWRVRICKTNAHPCEPFHIRGRELHSIGISREILIGARIAHSHIIRHHENHVGPLNGGSTAEEKGDKKSEREFHRE